jgi:excisionase family DNA binding protein
MQTQHKTLLDIHETAEFLGCSWRHVQNLKDRRAIPHLRLGRLVRFRKADIERALDQMVIREITIK